MLVNAGGLFAHMSAKKLKMVVVEVPDVNVPKCGYQPERTLAKRLIVERAQATNGRPSYITYAMYNSFTKSNSYVPADFKFEILDNDTQARIVKEYEDHKNGLEAAFREAYNEYNPHIQDKLKRAKELIQEAQQLSVDTGIPFSFNPPDGNESVFTPATFRQKFGNTPNLNTLLESVSGIYASDEGWSGNWDSSSANC